MEHKFLFGSKMLKLNNNRDEDWLTFTTENAKIARENGCKSIPFYEAINNSFIRGNNIRPDPYNALYLYQLSNGFIEDDDYPFKHFNIFDNVDVWKKWLKAYINSAKVEEKALKESILSKRFYHLLYQYYMIIEDTHWISDEAKEKVQKIHDLEMPSSYFYELKDLINSL